MKYSALIKLVAAIALAIFLLDIPGLAIEPAVAQVNIQGTFRATRSCEAKPSIRGSQNPGNIQVSSGQKYEALSFNSDEREFIYIKVPRTTPERRWVNANCGEFSETVVTSPITPPPIISDRQLLPFFDSQNNLEIHGFPKGQSADITPPAPQLSNFDLAVLKTCGPLGNPVKRDAFRQLMLSNQNVLREIKQTVGGQIRTNRRTEAEFLDDLTGIWFNQDAFEHIFCGEIEGRDKIGGLHFVGRYLELQQNKRGGRLPNNLAKEEVKPEEVFTLGIRLVSPEGRVISEDDIKGYALVSNAKEILIDATKAFKTQGNVEGTCLYPVVDRETGKSFSAVFVKSENGIVTFYPDATPKGSACRIASR